MFECECNDGYKLDGSGGNCTDIDECESPQSCLYGDCTNLEGSFRCICPKNYELIPEGNACIGTSNVNHFRCQITQTHTHLWIHRYIIYYYDNF